ncbi:cell division cycle protein 23 homolog [Hyalella azteca]|uniref:Cell division cycle protein 23 homolog n=1 Tax=Hyalella azteca TaxID=294128 RepID=A0A8B7N115_HYAAZ|nr:cell division cycle protein 23 homolog [Hyalella azteca]
MAGGYDGLHDMTAIIFGTTLSLKQKKSETIESDFTRRVKIDLIKAKEEANHRGLLNAYSWCADLALCVKDVTLLEEPTLPPLRQQLGSEADDFDQAKGLFNLKDYFRAAYYSEHLKHPLGLFLHLYSRYCAYEQKINNDRMDSITLLPKNVPGPHLFEIAHRLGPAYHRVSKKENFPYKTKGVIGLGDYEYKTKHTKHINVKSVPSTSKLRAKRKLSSHLNDHINEDKFTIDHDLGDNEIAHLGDDVDDIEVDDENESSLKLQLDSSSNGTGVKSDELKEDDIICGYDSYLMYLYGVVLQQLGHRKQALEVLCWAIHLSPINWAAWAQLAHLIDKRSTLEQLDLPDVWQRRLFLCEVFVELNLDADALAECDQLMAEGLEGSAFLKTQRALAFRNLRELDLAIAEFESIERSDPFRVASVDVFSNLLYVKERRTQLANLAAKMVQVAKYSVETCCVVGNYLSLRGEHEKAVVHFQRALKLNPKFVSAYTLMGYEYMEMKSTIQAIQCYRNALKVNRRDYSAWFGLGQTYEVLRLLNYSLFYFKQAQRLHPYDSRMITALGEAFEKKEMFLEAKKCYVKAHSVGDVEGTALLKLAKLYQRLAETERAADAYERYLRETEGEESDEAEERGRAHLYLAEFLLSLKQFATAEEYAKKCMECAETQEASKSLLKEIAHKRNLTDANPALPQRDEPRPSLVGNRARSSDDDPPVLPHPLLRLPPSP